MNRIKSALSTPSGAIVSYLAVVAMGLVALNYPEPASLPSNIASVLSTGLLILVCIGITTLVKALHSPLQRLLCGALLVGGVVVAVVYLNYWLALEFRELIPMLCQPLEG